MKKIKLKDKGFYLTSFFALLVLLTLPIGVQADPVLDFGIIAPTPGGISYGGGIAPLKGKNISIDNVTGLETFLNPDVSRNLINGTLNFTTGNSAGFDGTHWYFSSGGEITVTGGVDLNGDGQINPSKGDIPWGSILLTGHFDDTTTVIKSGATFKVGVGSFVDNINPKLANFYGLSDNTYSGNWNLGFIASGSPPNKFTSTLVLSGDLTTSSPVPEPATMLLLGSGLIGLVGLGRRKLCKTSA